MALVKLPNGQLKEDQRKNGARLKLSGGDWLKIILFIITVVWGYAILTATVNHNSTVLANQGKQLIKIDNRSLINEQCVMIFKDDIKEIKRDVKDILKVIK